MVSFGRLDCDGEGLQRRISALIDVLCTGVVLLSRYACSLHRFCEMVILFSHRKCSLHQTRSTYKQTAKIDADA